MASTTIRPSSRYSSSSSPSPSPSPSDLKSSNNNNSNSSRLSSLKHTISNASGRRNPSDLTMMDASRALARTRSGDVVGPLPSKSNSSGTFGTMVKKFIEKRSHLKPLPPVPAAAEDVKRKKNSLTATLHRKLFTKDRPAATKALTEVKANTRTLAMVLRSERELLAQSQEHELQIQELNLVIEEKNREVEKLKDLCLKQREEIKALKDAILFPDVMNSQLHDLFEKQGAELKQARQIIPCLQKQVSSLTGQIQCLADGLAEVKADKYSTMCFDGHISSPETPKTYQKAQHSLECSSGCPMTYGSPDEMFLKDLNPCLTPWFSKTKSKDCDGTLDFDSPSKDISFQNSAELSPDNFSRCRDGTFSKSSELCLRPTHAISTTKKMYMSDERKWSVGKPRHQSLI